jgi:hypothetical protein
VFNKELCTKKFAISSPKCANMDSERENESIVQQISSFIKYKTAFGLICRVKRLCKSWSCTC